MDTSPHVALTRRCAALLSIALAPFAVPAPSAGTEPGAAPATTIATTTTLSAPSAYAGDPVVLEVAVASEDGSPPAAAPVTVERRRDDAWVTVATPVTDASGRASVQVRLGRRPERNLFRATYAGDATYAKSRSAEVTAPLLRRATRLRLDVPERIVDESYAALTADWRTTAGQPVRGRVRIYKRPRGGSWRHVRTVRTGADGVVSFRVRTRHDRWWSARTSSLPWVAGDRSGAHLLDNVPRMAPVRLPADAPRPRIGLPRQPRSAPGTGAQVTVRRIPDWMWRHMTGRSWHRGCPVGRSGLRLVRANYWAYDGYRRRGELVVNAGAAPQFVRALRAQHWRRLPVRSMYRVDRFGWSDRLQGGNDYRSMAAGNTSAFNCRDVVGRPGVVSPHSWGRSFDINPWENPYRSRDGWVPNGWWVGRSHPQVAWRDRSHLRVRVMGNAGFAWTYGVDDAHHFDARTSSGRVLRRGVCDATACH